MNVATNNEPTMLVRQKWWHRCALLEFCGVDSEDEKERLQNRLIQSNDNAALATATDVGQEYVCHGYPLYKKNTARINSLGG
jgi:hypothetical protein